MCLSGTKEEERTQKRFAGVCAFSSTDCNNLFIHLHERTKMLIGFSVLVYTISFFAVKKSWLILYMWLSGHQQKANNCIEQLSEKKILKRWDFSQLVSFFFFFFCRKMMEVCGEAENRLAAELMQHELQIEKDVLDPLSQLAEVRVERFFRLGYTCTNNCRGFRLLDYLMDTLRQFPVRPPAGVSLRVL